MIHLVHVSNVYLILVSGWVCENVGREHLQQTQRLIEFYFYYVVP